eukprot:SAG11_NODE_530_length_8718_cov_12.724910_2_plen_1534_part_00
MTPNPLLLALQPLLLLAARSPQVDAVHLGTGCGGGGTSGGGGGGTAAAPQQITFSQLSWLLKSSGKAGPGPNFFNQSNAAVDEQGRLHLRITPSGGGGWACAKVHATKPRASVGVEQQVPMVPALLGLVATVKNLTFATCGAHAHDSVDSPTRAFVDDSGVVHLSTSCRTTHLMTGPMLLTVERQPGRLEQHQWLSRLPFLARPHHAARAWAELRCRGQDAVAVFWSLKGTSLLDHWDALVRARLDFGADDAPSLGLKSDDLLMFQPVVEGSAAATTQTEAVMNTADQQPNLDMSQLATLDMDPALMKFIGNVVTQLHEMKDDNVALQNRTRILETKNVALQNRTLVLEVENKAVHAEVKQVKKDRDALENKTHFENAALRNIFLQLSNKTIVKKDKDALRNNTQVLDTESKSVHAEHEQLKADKEVLEEFIGPMLLEMKEMKDRMQAVEMELQNKALVEEDLRGEIEWLKRDREAFKNNTHAFEAELRKENVMFWIKVGELQNQTKKDTWRINVRLDQCENLMDTFPQVVERRQAQEQTPACGREAVDSMLAVCCAPEAPAGNGHRLQEAVGCDSLPPTCSLQCSDLFISIFDNCYDDALMRGLSVQQLADWTSFYTDCSDVEQSAAEIGPLQAVDVRVVEQYHAQCTTADMLTCVFACNTTTHGYLLLVNINGEDTKLTCELHHGLYSWNGGSADGGFMGADPRALYSAVFSGAAGTYVGTLSVDANISTALTVHRDQIVQLAGNRALPAPPVWGSGGFVITEGGSLALEYVAFLASPAGGEGVGSSVLTVQAGGTLSVADSLLLQPAAAAAEWAQPVPLPCDGGADGACHKPHSGTVVLEEAAVVVSLAVPLVCDFWTDNCHALPAGVTAAQHAAGLAAGVARNADAFCFLHGVGEGKTGFVVPDDLNLLVSAGQGADDTRGNYDPSMPQAWRCDTNENIANFADNYGNRTQGRGPFGINQTSDSWYRLPAGKGLPTAPPGEFHCGTPLPGWLTGWATGAEGTPDLSYTTPADGSVPPPVGEPPATATMCFNAGSGQPCYYHTTIRAMSCGAFVLWELPPAPRGAGLAIGCSGYCLAPDPCADCAAAGRCTAGSWAGLPPTSTQGNTCANDDSTYDSSTRNGRSTYATCSRHYDDYPEDCGQYDDEDFTAATQCCACGGGFRDPAHLGRCACSVGWAGPLCADATSMPPGVSREQHDRAVAAGVDPNADPVCFTAEFVTVPDDPNLLTSAGQGGRAGRCGRNYDAGMPAYRCDGAEGTITDSGGDDAEGRVSCHGPFGLRHGGGANDTRWYQLPIGKRLPTAPPGRDHCGTGLTGWLSGWPAGAEMVPTSGRLPVRLPGTNGPNDPGQPDGTYATPADGSLPPPVGAPPAAGIVCFGVGNTPSQTCDLFTPIRAVSCGAFALWELPPSPTKDLRIPFPMTFCTGFCLAPDPCVGCAAVGRCTADSSWVGYPADHCINDDSTRGSVGRYQSYSCTGHYDSTPEDCGQHDDDDFTAATQCCACGGGFRNLTHGHCACTPGWSGPLCDERTSG